MSLADWIAHRAAWSPEKVAIRFESEAITYAAFDARIRGLAAALDARGIRPGDRVAYLGLNRPLVFELLFACARLGAIFAPLNWRLPAAEQRGVIAHVAPALLFVEREFAGEPWPLETLDADAARGDAAASPPSRGDADSPVLMVSTSGATGRPKGVLLTQGALFWNAVNSIAAHDLGSDDRVLTVLPTFHVGGLHIHTTPAFHAGATVTLHRRFEPEAALAAIAADRITVFLCVPPVSLAMIRHPAWATTDLSSLRVVTSGSSIVPEASLRPWLERGIPATQVYGSSESAPIAILIRAEDSARKIGSCGKPAMHVAARIADEDGRVLGTDERGEVQLRGPNLFREYWNDPEATAAAFTSDGWFRTGDVGHRDADGFWWIDDRKKDVVISGGENVYPAELEAVLAGCDEILEAAVVGRPDERWGEAAVAFVVTRPGAALAAAQVLALFEGRLARYKHPRDVVFVESLPRNAMGKVLKNELRARAKGS